MQQSNNEAIDHPIVLFDGVCNLCNSAVQFVIKRDPNAHFRFAPLQSQTGQRLLKQFNLSTEDFNTIVIVENGKHYVRSTAGLRLMKDLNNAWPLLYGFIIVPRFIRDAVYDFISKNRYKWFGKQESCMMPTPDLKRRFLD